jgi:hypothetical protein
LWRTTFVLENYNDPSKDKMKVYREVQQVKNEVIYNSVRFLMKRNTPVLWFIFQIERVGILRILLTHSVLQCYRGIQLGQGIGVLIVFITKGFRNASS